MGMGAWRGSVTLNKCSGYFLRALRTVESGQRRNVAPQQWHRLKQELLCMLSQAPHPRVQQVAQVIIGHHDWKQKLTRVSPAVD